MTWNWDRMVWINHCCCSHCYCIFGTGYHGLGCQRSYKECCRCGKRVPSNCWTSEPPYVWPRKFPHPDITSGTVTDTDQLKDHFDSTNVA